MTAARARLALAIGVAISFATLAALGFAYLSPDSMRAFDTYLFGYDLNHARTYIRALGPIEVAVYTGPYRVLDTLFPLLLATLMAMMLHHRTRRWSVVPQLLLMVLPGAYLVMDLAENALVAQLVTSQVGDLRADAVNLASNFTVTKFVMFGATVSAIAVAHVVGQSA